MMIEINHIPFSYSWNLEASGGTFSMSVSISGHCVLPNSSQSPLSPFCLHCSLPPISINHSASAHVIHQPMGTFTIIILCTFLHSNCLSTFLIHLVSPFESYAIDGGTESKYRSMHCPHVKGLIFGVERSFRRPRKLSKYLGHDGSNCKSVE